MSTEANRRFILDNDGDNVFYNLGKDLEATIAETVQECSPEVTTYMLCSAAGTCYYPTKVGCTSQKNKGLLVAHKRGVDPFGMLLQGIKASGKETFITYRMNDVHNPTDADMRNTPRVRREHPDCIVGTEEVKAGKSDWMSYCLDYSRSEVRNYVLALIHEQIQRYGDTIDGFQLDWMRFPRHLSGTPDEVWKKRDIITDFMAEVREILRKSGRPILLSARVPTTPSGCRRLGFDLAGWGHRNLVDLLVVCPFLTTEWHIPVKDIRGWMVNPAIPVYAGFDFGFGRQYHFPESLRGICTSLYDRGADGIYVFNFPCWTECLAVRPYHWLLGLANPQKASAKPLLLAVEHSHHRVAGVDQPAHLPAMVPAGGSLKVPLWIPRAALPACRAIVLVHSHGNIGLALNERVAAPLRFGISDEPHRSEIFLEFINQSRDKNGCCPKPKDCRTFTVAPVALSVGRNDIRISNMTDGEIEIERINLGLW